MSVVALASNGNGRRKLRRRKRPTDRSEMGSVICVASLTALYLLFLYQTSNVLDTVEKSENFRFHSLLFDARKKNSPKTTEDVRIEQDNKSPAQLDNQNGNEKFLIFVGQLGGQGTGNIISGLLAAHLLGEEFGRIVCVQNYPEFTALFEMANPITISKCPKVASAEFPPKNGAHHFKLINYIGPPNECALQDNLASDIPILFMTGNTYPRWPTVPDNFFFKYYKAKPELLQALPYDPQSPPTTVVHLREPDSQSTDFRQGLDDASLTALGNLLPKGSNTFLVTNNVAYYERFEQCCQWAHPKWDTVVHSALDRQWGPNKRLRNSIKSKAKQKAQQNIQMWSDWYTVLTAPTVYHTHSDFSVSAIHWSNKMNSHSLQGLNSDGTIKTVKESWWVDGETEPLAERRIDATGTAQLRLCGGNSHPFQLKSG